MQQTLIKRQTLWNLRCAHKFLVSSKAVEQDQEEICHYRKSDLDEMV